ncbi:ArsR/SmtB family transcription factor [Acinetobacter rudis]|uniref:Metalloregulator ArsR/SmtB family transcription factor n=1 Tax=Acinetobacter rudis TaxID=632955 RepID=A0AAW8J9A2_9GAMM|nr:metalloregulator ArsR/SmtB family transcription factor [Acinetobacter rudis]MDQ8936335.1 metalloregulator ArsR/SmtB family transcription factor [Acinetobacter rudis]MDQ8953441.1 metalloregulator ArsR/SmtB family transcription factor [Acinetobacter rudis]MDQ9018596.1 metalloregulator ArsR/SmtB family transcription factor [Acinetobacter rudis]
MPSSFSIDFSQVDYVAQQLKVLSNPDRLKILCVLKDGEIHVQQIETLTNIQQPTLSQQLTLLRRAKLVTTRRDGKQIFYSIAEPKVLLLMQQLYQLYCQN